MQPQLHIAAAPQERPAKAASLQQSHFAHWLVSWVLCDCNWLESLKLASPCQSWKLWNHKAWSSYQACWSLMAGRIRAPEWWTFRPQAGSQTPFSRPPRALSQMGALSRAFSFPSLKAVSGWTDFGLIEVGGIGKWEQMGRRVKWVKGTRRKKRKGRKCIRERDRIYNGKSFININILFLCNWV